jgi:oxygen-independent coproporphyrinogen-3 oxidase
MQQPGSGKALGIYIHIPFCRSKCEYCDFYSLAAGRERDAMDRYPAAVNAHLREAAQRAGAYTVDTIYFGGGTPSYLGADRLKSILTEIFRRFDVAKDAEITLEANPDSLTPREARKLQRAGFNRISIGVQSDSNELLKALGRPHNYQQAVAAVQAAREGGFNNISIDLMYGLPNQTREQWMDTLAHIIQLKPEHISCYGLKVEPGTPLYSYRDCANLPDDDTQADMYLYAVNHLESYGYGQYEISNFSFPGRESRHNLKYWLGGEYLGFGPSAASDFAGKRFTCAPDLEGYMSGVLGGGVVLSECESLPQHERAAEYVMLRLRTRYGLEPDEYTRRFALPFAPLAAELGSFEALGLAQHDGSRWRLTPNGYLVSNQIIGTLLDVQQDTAPLPRGR